MVQACSRGHTDAHRRGRDDFASTGRLADPHERAMIPGLKNTVFKQQVRIDQLPALYRQLGRTLMN